VQNTSSNTSYLNAVIIKLVTDNVHAYVSFNLDVW